MDLSDCRHLGRDAIMQTDVSDVHDTLFHDADLNWLGSV